MAEYVLVRKDNPKVRMVATSEVIPGHCDFHSVALKEDGSIGELTYGGGTEVYWDEQQTETNEQGHRLFIDENGMRLWECDVVAMTQEAFDAQKEG